MSAQEGQGGLLIETALQQGWQPAQHGRPFTLQWSNESAPEVVE